MESVVDLNTEYHPAAKGDRLRRTLSTIPGLTFCGPYTARLPAGKRKARVLFDSFDALRVEYDVRNPRTPARALETNHLPGNLRFAIARGHMRLMADTQIDGQAHLEYTLPQLGLGIRLALSWEIAKEQSGQRPVEPKDVDKALENLSWQKDSVVKLDSSWELRPRCQGQATPVKLTIDESGLRLHRTVLGKLRDECRFEVLAAQALRFNAILRHARLAWNGRQFIAESRLHAGQVEPSWIALAARAVATAESRVKTVMQILAEQDDVAEHYAKMFLDS